jgi:D-xylono/L-arabinono-1,4-lactonase
MRPIEPEMVVDPGCSLAEGPLWHALESRLYWVDIPSGTIYRFSPHTKVMESFPTGEVIGGYTIQEDGSLLLFGAKGCIRTWQNGKIVTVLHEIKGEGETRFNDVIATPEGGVFCGTLSSKNQAGTLYYLTPQAEIIPVLRNVLCSNGMGFDLNRRLFYHTDSDRQEIFRFDYLDNGKIANRISFARIPDNEGIPDGMTVDGEGYLWSTRWKGNCLVRYDPDGTEVLRIPFPAHRVTSLTFGGSDYTNIFVTTAGGNNKQNEGWGAGAVFRLRPDIRGVPELLSRVYFAS